MVEVTKKTPPLLVHSGESFKRVRFPEGTRVVYPAAPLPGLEDPDAAIAHALDHPLNSEPLNTLLRPGMKLTIAFDDISLPLPPMQLPDVRQRVIEEVLTRAAAAGVTDVVLIAALSLHRRMTDAELRRAIGDRVFDAFHPHRLYNHDAEDPDEMIEVGVTDQGEIVDMPKRAMDSDLLVYVNINLVAMDGGHKSVPVGLGSYRSVRAHHNPRTLYNSRSYMDPPNSAISHSCDRQGRLLAGHLKIFTIETTLNNDTFSGPLQFLQRRENTWSPRDRAAFSALQRTVNTAPGKQVRDIFHSITSPYQMTSVQAGETEAVHESTLTNFHRQQLVPVQGQADVMVAGIPYISPYNVNSILNPILVNCMALGYFFNLYRGKPLVREGGVMIAFHPVKYEWHPIHHPSYVDFYDTVLSETLDPVEIEARYEEDFAYDPWYRHLYRTSHAYHGVHPFYMWYWAADGMRHVARTIFVGGDPKTTHHMGFMSASSLDDALEMASDIVGNHPSITYLHAPPLMLCDVT
ncbi:MAG TPA: lactate racemase domain-containing protein [Candidatus Dormibacteraeota bacterium]|nr:lactate racemase domain-containing protein [Candidatus Dormibacteraeota bacterium]